jgi:hypothetical protein
MAERNPRLMPQALFEDFENGHSSREPVDGFRSVLIAAYEQAIIEGISPITALSEMLDWASQEIKRYTR